MFKKYPSKVIKMTLEELLKPVKWVDTQVVKGYTKVGERFHLEEGKNRYFAAAFLSITSGILCSRPAQDVSLQLWDRCSALASGLVDSLYNWYGMVKQNKDDQTDGTKVIDPAIHLFKRHNSIMRLPTLLSGVGLITKSGIDLYYSFKEGTPVSEHCYDYFQWGLGQLALASSMYLKAMDPKLLNRSKQPFWKRVYSSLQERVRSLAPQPAPVPVPVATYSTIDNTIDTYLLEK